MVKSLVSLFKSTEKERKVTKQKKKKVTCKILVKRKLFFRVRLLSEKNDLLKIFFLIIVIFLDNKYIKTLLNSNKMLSENFKPISCIKLEIIC